ncbi:MAG: hypothetical protein Kow00128_22790 [Deltaproteobacteria bacterium]
MAMSELEEIKAEFEELTGVKKATPISKERVLAWMQSKDIQVLGAVCYLIFDKRCYPRIEPPLTINDFSGFLMHYYGRCFRENPDGKWSQTRYEAGWAVANWFAHLWDDKTVPRKVPSQIKDWLGRIYKEGNEEIRTCVITATLEHLFEHKGIAGYFADWKKDPSLKLAYDEAMGYAKHLRAKK